MGRPAPFPPITDGDIARVPIMARGGMIRAWALIDAADIGILGVGPWCLSRSGYPIQRRGDRIVFLHRLVLLGVGVADHISGDRLDCRRANLRRCTQKDNSRNAPMKGNRSGFKGVRLTAHGRFNARIMVDRRGVHIGNFATAEDAARAYDAAAIEHFGEFARLNFPSLTATKVYADTAGVDVLIKPWRREAA